MKISTFRGTQPFEMKYVSDVVDITVDQLESIICQSAWSPFLFEPDESGRMHRHNNSFLETSLMTFDIDEGLSLAEALDRCKNDAVIIATTKSHQVEKVSGKTIKPPCDRFRVILFLERPIISKEEYEATWKAQAKRIGSVDDQCKDLCRFYFPCREVVFRNHGIKIAVVAPPETLGGSCRAKQPSVERKESTTEGELHGRLFPSTHEFIRHGTDKSWHTEILKAAMDLKEQGYSYNEATDLLEGATAHYLGYLDEHDIGVIRDVYNNRGGKYEKRLSRRSEAAKPFVPPTEDEQVQQYLDQTARRRRASSQALTFLDPAFDRYYKIENGLTLIGAQTGNGKSTVCYNLISYLHLAERCSKRILLLSNEATEEEVYSKVACLMLGWDWERDYHNGDDENKLALITGTIKELAKTLTVVTSKLDEYDTSDLDDVKRILEHAKGESDRYAMVLIDYLQTIVTCKSRRHLKPHEISYSLGSYLKRYAQICDVPVVIFAQLWADSDSRPDFPQRVQYDRMFANHAHTCLEVIPDHGSRTTTIRCHKQRWGPIQRWEVTLQYERGRLLVPKVWDLDGLPMGSGLRGRA